MLQVAACSINQAWSAAQVSTHSLADSIARAPLRPPLYSTLMAVSAAERTSLKTSLHAVRLLNLSSAQCFMTPIQYRCASTLNMTRVSHGGGVLGRQRPESTAKCLHLHDLAERRGVYANKQCPQGVEELQRLTLSLGLR